MDETFSNTSLDDFVIKDKDYRLNKLKKNIKIFVIIISILVVIGGLTYFIIKILTKTYGEITCIYQTYKDKYSNIKEIKNLVRNCPKFNADLEIIKFINSGSCGIVYEGKIKGKSNKKVALKFLLNKIMETKRDKINNQNKPKFLPKNNKEISLQTKIKHKNITAFYGVYAIPDSSCMVMELAKYGDLDYFQKKFIQKSCLSETLLAYITKQILNGLSF